MAFQFLFLKRELGGEFESLAVSVDEFVPSEMKEEFHQFIRITAHILTNNVSIKLSMKPNHSRVTKILSYFQVKKDGSMVIMEKMVYDKKVEEMTNKGTEQRKYKETDDNIFKELKPIQSFLSPF